MSNSTVFYTNTSLFYANTTQSALIRTISPGYDNCQLYQPSNSNSSWIIIEGGEGIPENLIINIVIWPVLIILFTVLRGCGDYGRFGLVENEESEGISPRIFARYITFKELLTKKNYKNFNSDDHLSTTSNEELNHQSQDSNDTRKSNVPHIENYPETHFYSWFIHFYKLKDEHITAKAGTDALYYMVFQRYLIAYLSLVTLLSLIILLPINTSNNEKYNIQTNDSFSHTTIVNIDPNSPLLWAHLVISWIFLVFGYITLGIFSHRISYIEDEYYCRTVLIRNFPKEFCKKTLIYKHFKEAYPEMVIEDIQFAYSVKKLLKLKREKHVLEIGKIAAENFFRKEDKRPLMHTFHCGTFFELFCHYKKYLADSIDFYNKKINEIDSKMSKTREKSLEKPLGFVFITFEKQAMAEKLVNDYKFGFLSFAVKKTFRDCCSNHIAKSSSFSKELKSDQWIVKNAYSPFNIKWENIAEYGVNFWIRCVMVNSILLVVMLFFTTPSIILEKLNTIGGFQQLQQGAIGEFLPSIVLLILTAAMPPLISLTALIELHWNRSSENRSQMIKAFLCYLFMILLLPTLGLTSITTIFDWLIRNQEFKWRCLSNNGAFFIKYVCTTGIIGTALDVARLPDIFLYMIRTLWSRSTAERAYVRVKSAFDFDYGFQYARIITIFAVTVCFSAICPLITPFGLTFMILKHFADRYNIYFGYLTTKCDKNTHRSAITFTLFAITLSQFYILFFVAISNNGNLNTNEKAIVQLVVVVISCLIFIGRIFFVSFERFSPFTSIYKPMNKKSPQLEDTHFEVDNQSIYDNNFNSIRQPSIISKTGFVLSQKIFPSVSLDVNDQEIQSPYIPSVLLDTYNTPFSVQTDLQDIIIGNRNESLSTIAEEENINNQKAGNVIETTIHHDEVSVNVNNSSIAYFKLDRIEPTEDDSPDA